MKYFKSTKPGRTILIGTNVVTGAKVIALDDNSPLIGSCMAAVGSGRLGIATEKEYKAYKEHVKAITEAARVTNNSNSDIKEQNAEQVVSEDKDEEDEEDED